MFKFLFTMKLIFWGEKGSWAVLKECFLGSLLEGRKLQFSDKDTVLGWISMLVMYVFSYL